MPPGGRLGPGFLTEEEKHNQPKVTKELLLRIYSYLKPYRKQMLLVLISILCSAILTLMPSVLTGKIIDEGLIAKNLRALVLFILLSFGVTLLANLIGILESYLNTWIAQHITYDMRNKMYRHLQTMSQRFFTTNNQGDIITRMTSDISGVQQIITGTLTSSLSNAITLIVALVLMFRQNWILALVGIAVVPLFTIPTRSAGKRRWAITKDSQACSDEINGILNETLSVSGQLLVKLFGMEEKENQRYEAVNKRMIGLNIKESMAGRWFRMALSTFTNIGPMLIYLIGGLIMMRYDESVTVGQISVLVALLGKMYMPVNQLLNIQVDWIRSMAMFTRIFEYYDMKPEIENAPDAITPETVRGEVEFRNVRFYYDADREILKNISFRLEQGKCIAIVGPSGSGKSTLINLIPRLYDVIDGSVLFDGEDVRRLDLGFLRENIGIVSQETYLFNGTIRENLLYAKPDATEAELIEACRQANIYDFVEKQEQGLDTVVGNRGLKLSGGEKQRISIA
ncbi:MAG: ABC transporter ATP-binding protein, partial [Oscillospiraceae bacterium]|nr:ABC transporter ATP-binding protein [Oscillospiraceae bacterium]